MILLLGSSLELRRNKALAYLVALTFIVRAQLSVQPGLQHSFSTLRLGCNNDFRTAANPKVEWFYKLSAWSYFQPLRETRSSTALKSDILLRNHKVQSEIRNASDEIENDNCMCMVDSVQECVYCRFATMLRMNYHLYHTISYPRSTGPFHETTNLLCSASMDRRSKVQG